MSDPEKIKVQTTVESRNVTPDKAAEDLDELKEKELEGVSGGILIAPYPDWAATPGVISPIRPKV